jgi:hypothetical protein
MTAATSPTESALDSRVRRAARAAGLAVRRSRRALGVDNGGGYRLIDPAQNFVVLRERFDMTAADVIEYCRS